MAGIQFGAPTPPVEEDGAKRIDIPPSRYTSSAFMELEREHLWPNVWLMAGLASDVRQPGDYFVFDMGHTSMVVARDNAGELGAFHNVCLHRGHTLRDPGRGNCASFVCPYHAWEWGLDGALCKVPSRSRFPQGFPEARRKLAEVTCQEWAGLVWICIGAPRESLESYLGPIHEHVGAYKAEELHANTDWTAHWPCNWKTAIDGFNETYHGPATHPQFAEFLDTHSAVFQFGAKHSVFVIKHGVRPPSAKSEEILEPIAGMLRRAGADPRSLAGRTDEARSIVQQWVRKESARLGHHFDRLSDDQLTDTHHFYIFPNLHIDFHGANDASIQRFRPHPTDPNRCLMDVFDFKRLKGDYLEHRAEHIEVLPGAEQRGIVYAQDIERLSRVQLGMHSPGFPGAHLSNMERRIYHMHLVIDQYLEPHLLPSMRTTVSDPESRAQAAPAAALDR